MECVNTAIEIIVDMVSPKYNEAAGRAKDIAAGGVLACAIGAAVAGIFIFLPKVLEFIIRI